jgi:hypothetical protein
MSQLKRVTRADPCAVCHKDNWCIYSDDVNICMRVVSPNAKTFADGTVGYIHNRGEHPSRPYVPTNSAREPEVFVDSARIVRTWRGCYGLESLTELATNLGLSRGALESLGCVKAPQEGVWGFPMSDSNRTVIGIRMRHLNGRKWCNTGGHNGLFIPLCPPPREIVICEGPTDTAAALHIGLYAIGRFSCSGGGTMVRDFIKHHGVKRASIIADVDHDRQLHGQTVNPGIQGAMTLGELLGIHSRCVTLPGKDLREFVANGGTESDFQTMANQIVWNK